MSKLLVYLLRWQLSTPVLFVVTYLLVDYGTLLASIVANLIGGLIFYKIDKIIFNGSNKKRRS